MFSNLVVPLFPSNVDPISTPVYLLGLRLLAGYASLSDTMSCHVFCMRTASCAVIWLVRLCTLPTPTPDDDGDASFPGPSRAPTQKVHMGSRARARGRTQLLDGVKNWMQD